MREKKGERGEISRQKKRYAGVKEGGKKVKEVGGELPEKQRYILLSLPYFPISPPLANMPPARVFLCVCVRRGERRNISSGKEAA